MNNIAICYASNVEWYGHLRTAVWSARKMLGDSAKIYVLTDSYWDPMIYGCTVVNVTKYMMSVGIFPDCWNRKLNFSTLWRLSIPLVEEFKEFDKVVYLDTDTLVMSSDVVNIIGNLDVSQHEILAAKDINSQQGKNRSLIDGDTGVAAKAYLSDYWSKMGVADRTYVNDGVLIFNLKKIRENGIDFYKKKLELFWRGVIHGKYEFLDQDFINIMMDVDSTMPSCLNNFVFPDRLAHLNKIYDRYEDRALINHYLCEFDGMNEQAALLGYSRQAEACKDIPCYPEDLSKNKQLIMYLCHIVNDEAIWRYRKLVGDLQGTNFDVIWVLTTDMFMSADLPPDIKCESYTSADMKKSVMYTCLNNRYLDSTSSSVQWALMTTFNRHPDYDYYWSIEYDVCYAGDWKTFFSKMNRYSQDHICENLVSYRESLPWWIWWDRTFLLRYSYTRSYESLNCISRFSRKLCNKLKEIFETDNQSGEMYSASMFATVSMNEGSCFDIAKDYGDGIMQSEVKPTKDTIKRDKLYHSISIGTNWREVIS